MIRSSKWLLLSVLYTFSLCTLAQAPVTDISSPQRRSSNNTANNSATETGYPASTYPTTDSGAIEQPSNYPTDSYPTNSSASEPVSIERPSPSTAGDQQKGYRSAQQAEDEVAALRGEVEELRYAVKQLQQDMLTLSRNNANSTSNTASPAAANAAANTVSSTGGTMTNEGKAEYETAYNKLKNKDHDGAIAGFKSVVDKYPNSEYAGSSQFWLGFVYQTKGDMDNAIKSFSTLVDKFPSHSKTPDAKYNLGKLYHQQGNTTKAKELLKDVAASGSKSAPLAKSYLESMQ